MTMYRRKLEAKRRQRLARLMQRSGVMDQKDAVYQQPSWNKRRGFVNALRHTVKP